MTAYKPSYKPNSVWNRVPLLFEELKKAISDKLSGSQAANRLSMFAGQKLSRGAVLGYANRSGMSFQSVEVGKYPRLPKKPRIRQVPINITRQKVPSRGLPDELPMQADFLGLTIEEVGNGQCRYPRGEQVPYLFCGQPVAGVSSWCPHHFSIVSAGYSASFNIKTGVSNEFYGNAGGPLPHSRGRAG
jgi:hypothetical protein